MNEKIERDNDLKKYCLDRFLDALCTLSCSWKEETWES